jgi:hypothetical protein
LYQDDRITDAYSTCCTNGCPDTDAIVMVLGGSTENAQIALEISLAVRSHDATECRPQLH